jgi:ABC-2 type transport system permease protein
MAVHKRAYQPLTGGLTSSWSRFLVLPRYAWDTLSGSRLLIGALVLCLVPVLVSGAIIYVVNNPVVQSMLDMPDEVSSILAIDGKFFYRVLSVQGALAFLLTAWIGPGLVAPDLSNGALPLYLSRPFSRGEYVLGRFATLFILLSAITWVPDLLLFALQAGQAEAGWGWSHLYIARGIVLGSLVWIVTLSLLALALSAWVRWRMVATGVFAGIFFVSAGFGAILNDALRTYWGSALSLYYVITTIWRDLFAVAVTRRLRRVELERPDLLDVPVGYCWLVLVLLALACLLLLNRRLRGREVVRG